MHRVNVLFYERGQSKLCEDKKKGQKRYRETICSFALLYHSMLLIQLKMKPCPNIKPFINHHSSLFRQACINNHLWSEGELRRYTQRTHFECIPYTYSTWSYMQCVFHVLHILLRKNSVIFQDDWWESGFPHKCTQFCGQIKRQQEWFGFLSRFYFCLNVLKGLTSASIHLDDHLNDWFTQQ